MCLRWIPPEMAHSAAIFFLRAWHWWPYGKSEERKRVPAPGRKTSVTVQAGSKQITFTRRVGIAAGFDKNAEVFSPLFRLGAGFVEVGTVTPVAQSGNLGIRVWRLPEHEAVVNRLGFNNQGVKKVAENIRRGSIHGRLGPLLANIGKNRDSKNPLADYRVGFEALVHCVDGFVVNISSPNTPGLRDLQSVEFLEALSPEIPKDRPTWIKLAPDLSNEGLRDLCEFVAREKRLSGVVLTNTSRSLAEFLGGFKEGGLSGGPLFERTLECVSIAREVLRDKCLIAVGGISSMLRARLMRKAGADLVEIYTGMIYYGPGLIKELAELE